MCAISSLFFLVYSAIAWMSILMELYNYLTNLPRYNFFFILSLGYITYYLIEVVKVSKLFEITSRCVIKSYQFHYQRPILAAKDGPFKNYLLKYVDISAKFWPTIWCVESRAQTVFASFLRASVLGSIDYKR